MRERLHTFLCMVLVLVVFTGCKGAGTLLKVAVVAAYVGARVAVAAAVASKHAAPPPPTRTPEECGCVPVANGQTTCQVIEGEDRCVLECAPNFLYRDGLCVPEPARATP